MSSGVVIGAISGSLRRPRCCRGMDVVSRSTLASLYDDGAGARNEIGWSMAVLASGLLVKPFARDAGTWAWSVGNGDHGVDVAMARGT